MYVAAVALSTDSRLFPAAGAHSWMDALCGSSCSTWYICYPTYLCYLVEQALQVGVWGGLCSLHGETMAQICFIGEALWHGAPLAAVIKVAAS